MINYDTEYTEQKEVDDRMTDTLVHLGVLYDEREQGMYQFMRVDVRCPGITVVTILAVAPASIRRH